MAIRILLVDDHTLFRSGLKLLLQRQPDFEVVAEAGDGVEGLKRAQELKPDVVLLDLNLPGLSGLETLQLLTQDLPGCAVIILTVSEEADELGQALKSGARGYLVKNIDADALTAAIRRAASGEPVIAENMTAKLVEQFRGLAGQPAAPAGHAERHRLTAREQEIVRWLARGASNKIIARELDVSESTVKIHVQNVLKKLNLTSRVQVAVYAVEHSLCQDN
ncbi:MULTISPECIES: response regulator transcription factor [unclassified Achromobacter]|uniref:response regulator n=1 Tax=unclassified Achromobacter TaxID=2626865 RepID=UPI00069E8388|nr:MULTISPECIES: response regulator transcription factor [unclassified Achromobacter]KOF54138.1 XRE family transcriptional regulator [Achromobacter sp. DMS1]